MAEGQIKEISKWVGLTVLEERYQCTQRTIWRWQKAKGFPKARLKTRQCLWAWEDIIAWENEQIAA